MAFFYSYFGSSSSNFKFGKEVAFESPAHFVIHVKICPNKVSWKILRNYRSHVSSSYLLSDKLKYLQFLSKISKH